MNKEYKFSADELESQIPTLNDKGITEFSIHDEDLSKNKKRLVRIINELARYAPEVFVSLLIDVSCIDKEVVLAATQIYCAFEIPLTVEKKSDKLLFDKKLYAQKSKLLNDFGMVFGFQMTYAIVPGDSLKAFMDRLDFAVQQYPNHIDFPQTENGAAEAFEPNVTGFFSAIDIRGARNVAFACRTFYSTGRAVPWMLSVLKPLKIYPSKFFADFAEWQLCNNCDYKSGFLPENQKHKDIEKMQLVFLDEKYEEKHCQDMIPLVNDIVKINGAMSRVVSDNEEAVIETSYNPDDLLGPESFDLRSFMENVCMEGCRVKIFAGEEGPDYAVC